MTYDDGKRTDVDYDQAFVNSWSAIYRNFDAQGRLDSEDYFCDNGKRRQTLGAGTIGGPGPNSDPIPPGGLTPAIG